MQILFLVLAFFSGFTALVYEVAWQKYLASLLGAHAFATTVILMVFFLLLAVGYLVIGRLATVSRHKLFKCPLQAYGIIEGAIGLYCLLTPPLFQALSGLFSHKLGGPIVEFAGAFTFTTLFIGLPTFLMGGTIPLLSRGLARSAASAPRTHALVYATNTLGAFAGTVSAGFILIESFGLATTVRLMGGH